MRRSTALLLGAFMSSSTPALGADAIDIHQLLTTRICQNCHLADADLVHADLRDADLSGANLRHANLSQVNLDGANLRNSDLSFTSLRGASIRGADLRGSRLYGTDLGNADLSGAKLDPQALNESHWQGAQGIASGIRSHAALHNAGVEAALHQRWREAEHLFSLAVSKKPTEPLSWLARGISRGELGKINEAANDLDYAGTLFTQEGDLAKAEQLQTASKRLRQEINPIEDRGNGIGSTVLGGTLSLMKNLAPVALRALMPLSP